MNDTFKIIADLIEDIADIPNDEIRENSLVIDDLNLSSIEIMTIIAELERQFSIKISEKELLSIRSIKDLLTVIDKEK